MPSYDEPQQVYVIQHQLGLVKIGIAKDPESRLVDLQISCPFELRLKKTATPTDAKEVEQYLHSVFRNYRMRGEWFDLPPEMRDFEIPTHIDESGKPDVDIELPGDRDVENEWAHVLDRFVVAMKATKYETTAISRLRNDWQELGDGFDDDEDELNIAGPADSHEVKMDTPKGKVRCSQCGHHYDRGEDGCPMCSGGSFTDTHEHGRF